MAAAAAIATHGLTKRFRADVAALDGLELEVGRGEVFGFLGPNGAGKSTEQRVTRFFDRALLGPRRPD